MTLTDDRAATANGRDGYRAPCRECMTRKRHATRVGRITNQVVNDVMSALEGLLTDHQTWTIERHVRRAVAEGVEKAVELTSKDQG